MRQIFIPQTKEPFRVCEDLVLDQVYYPWEHGVLKDHKNFDGVYNGPEGKRIRITIPKGTVARINSMKNSSGYYDHGFVKLHILSSPGVIGELKGMTLFRLQLAEINKLKVEPIEDEV